MLVFETLKSYTQLVMKYSMLAAVEYNFVSIRLTLSIFMKLLNSLFNWCSDLFVPAQVHGVTFYIFKLSIPHIHDFRRLNESVFTNSPLQNTSEQSI